MADEPSFLAAIIARPADDAVRLVFADWLDERGGTTDAARAEYTRLEVAEARAGPAAVTPERTAAKHRAAALFKAHAAEWFPAFTGRRSRLRGGGAHVFYERGFPWQVYGAAHKLLEAGDELVRSAPLTSCEFRDLTEDARRRFVAAPWVARLRKINLNGSDTPAIDWALLADCPHLADLDELVTSRCLLAPAGAARLAAANPFPRLRRLSLLGARLPGGAARELFAGPAFAALEHLDLRGDLDRADLEAVAAAPALKQLQSFAAPIHKVPGLAVLITSAGFWPGLRRLELWRCDLGDAGAAELAAAPPGLRELILDDNDITAAGVQALAAGPLLGTLEVLKLDGNPIGPAGAAALAGSPRAAALRALDLGSCDLGDVGAMHLADSPHLAGLRELHLWSSGVALAGAKALAASPHLGGLVKLTVSPASAAARKHLTARFGAAVSF